MNKKIVWCNDSSGFGGSELSFMKVIDFIDGQFPYNVVLNPQVDTRLLEFFRIKNISVEYLYSDAKSTNIFRGLKKSYRILKNNPGVHFIIWSHHVDSNRWLQLALKLFRRKFIIVERSIPSSLDAFANSKLTKPLKKFVIKSAIASILNSRNGAILYGSMFNAPGSKLRIITNSVNVKDIYENVNRIKNNEINIRKSLNLKEGHNILCVGRLSEEKNYMVVLDAYIKIIKSLEIPVNLIFVGEDGGCLNALEKKVFNLSLDRVFFSGYTSEVYDWLAVADIFVLPSLTEGMSRALLEAMAAKVCCVVSDIPANVELITHLSNGLVFPANDPLILFNCISAMLSDEEMRINFTSASYNLVKEMYDIGIEKKNWYSFLCSLSK